jgi:hypothetical protein
MVFCSNTSIFTPFFTASIAIITCYRLTALAKGDLPLLIVFIYNGGAEELLNQFRQCDNIAVDGSIHIPLINIGIVRRG